MGLDVNGTKFLLYAISQGVSFVRTATIGRQGLHLSPESLRRNLALAPRSISRDAAAQLLAGHNGYAEGLLGLLGAQEVHSFDANAYEHANHLHDFNFELDARWSGYFDVVLDGGSLEHIFNFQVAIRNCMNMVRVGGHFLSISPANNFFGHGFYQFSPELYFRVLSFENGFDTRILLVEDRINGKWFELRDPAEMKQRGILVNHRPTYLMVIAKKFAQNQCFVSPQQSDYRQRWLVGDAQVGPPCFPWLQDHALWRGLSNLRDRFAWRFMNRYTKGMFKAL